MPQMLHVESESGLEWWNFDYTHIYLLKSKESMSDVVSRWHSPLKMEQLCNKNVCKNET